MLSPITPAPAPAGMRRGPGVDAQQPLPCRTGSEHLCMGVACPDSPRTPRPARGTMPLSADSCRQGPGPGEPTCVHPTHQTQPRRSTARALKSSVPTAKSAVAGLRPRGDPGVPALTLGPTSSVAALCTHLTFRSDSSQLSAPSEGPCPAGLLSTPPALIQIRLSSTPRVSHSSLGVPA